MSEKGYTLVELLVVGAITTIVATTTLVFSVPWIQGQSMRGATHDLHGLVQLAKIEAVARNRPCRLTVDTNAGRLQIWDMAGTLNESDDELLHRRDLGSAIRFERPDGGPAVTLPQIGSSGVHVSVFDAGGTVLAGTGTVHFRGGERYGRVSIHAAGGAEIAFWIDGSWAPL